ncbi:hypothetical protein CEXT_423611 [Caerostris extrusa]|uniref:Uncharacterized protein n=1 Tax=Caerostris extrusa TaxID=172846 RepID=A0AAV4SZT1_CAEEX|nr:hypothetical protein CEXT_423611 [Caerostris extrusa]
MQEPHSVPEVGRPPGHPPEEAAPRHHRLVLREDAVSHRGGIPEERISQEDCNQWQGYKCNPYLADTYGVWMAKDCQNKLEDIEGINCVFAR